jgi:c-di-AMP phosphodiesterase-like protein
LFVCFFSLLGYFHFSISWILLAVFIYLFRQQKRTQFKEKQKMLNQMNHNEEQYIKARLDELPSWVFFPDIERAEWVNRIIKQAWPYANKYLDKAIFHDIIIPMIRGTSPALADFSFEKLDLGEIVLLLNNSLIS